MRAAIALTALLVMASPSFAHSFYSPACCKGTAEHGDCEPIPFDAVTETKEGYRIVFQSPTQGKVDELVPYDSPNIHDSQDGRFHVCLRPQGFPSRIRCLYRTVNY